MLNVFATDPSIDDMRVTLGNTPFFGIDQWPENQRAEYEMKYHESLKEATPDAIKREYLWRVVRHGLVLVQDENGPYVYLNDPLHGIKDVHHPVALSWLKERFTDDEFSRIFGVRMSDLKGLNKASLDRRKWVGDHAADE